MGGGGQSSIGQLVRRHGACQRRSPHSAGNEACVRDVVPRVRVGALHSCAVPCCSLCRHTRARRRPGAFMVRGTSQCMLVCADGSYLSNDPRGTAEPSAFPAWRSEVLTPESGPGRPVDPNSDLRAPRAVSYRSSNPGNGNRQVHARAAAAAARRQRRIAEPDRPPRGPEQYRNRNRVRRPNTRTGDTVGYTRTVVRRL